MPHHGNHIFDILNPLHMNISRNLYKWEELRFASCTQCTRLFARDAVSRQSRVYIFHNAQKPETLLLFSWRTKISEDLDHDLFDLATPTIDSIGAVDDGVG